MWGETVAKKLARHYKTIDAIAVASQEELVAVNEIGTIIAMSVADFFSDEKQIEIIRRLKEYGIQLAISKAELEGQTEVLNGETFVISGVFHEVSRTELKKLIEKNGGKVSSSISAKTSYLVAGDKMGPSKLEKVKKLGIPMLSEKDFLTRIDYR